MAKDRKKKRTHKSIDESHIPKSMVIQTSSATTGRSISQLTKDTRLLMSPHTAAKLKERKNNRLRDYTTMAGPLGVTHLLLFNQSSTCPTLRIARTPRGPTLFFRIKEYSLNRDLSRVVRNPKSPGPEFNHAPLLVLNNFSLTSSKENPEEELLRTTFQNLFPALNTATASLHNMKRVVLVSRIKNEPGADIELRHYAINTRQLNKDKRTSKVKSGEKRKRRDTLPNLGKLEDVSEFLLGHKYESASESEFEEDSKFEHAIPDVKVKQEDEDVKLEVKTEQRGVKLVEIGPRMTLSLYKVTAEISAGAVLYHRDIHLTSAQQKELERKHEKMQALKEQRKKEQLANVKRKKEAKEEAGSRTKRAKLRAREAKAEEDMSEGELEEESRLLDASEGSGSE